MTTVTERAVRLRGVVLVHRANLAVMHLHDAQSAAGAEKHSAFYNPNRRLRAASPGFLLGTARAVLGPRRSASA